MLDEQLKELLGEEVAKQVDEKIGDKKLVINDGSYIPKAKFDEVNTAKNDYKQQLDERDKQLEELKKQAKGNDELTKQLESLQEENKKAIEEYEDKLKKQQLDFAVESKVMQAKARNPRAVKGLLDTEKIKLDGEQVLGLDEQLDEIKKSDPYLFADEKPSTPGANPAGGGEPQKTPQQEYDELMAEVQKNPVDQSLRNRLFIAKEKLKSNQQE